MGAKAYFHLESINLDIEHHSRITCPDRAGSSRMLLKTKEVFDSWVTLLAYYRHKYALTT